MTDRPAHAWKFGDHIGIEAISPLRYMLDPEGRGAACLDQERPGFGTIVQPGDIIIAGQLFGHGPGHDHAILAIREAGVAAVIARSFAPQFLRHAVDHGLPALESEQAWAIVEDGDTVLLDPLRAILRNLVTGVEAPCYPPTGPAAEILAAGGLIPFIAQALATRRADESSA